MSRTKLRAQKGVKLVSFQGAKTIFFLIYPHFDEVGFLSHHLKLFEILKQKQQYD